MAEIMAEITQPVVAHRGSFRWVQSFEAVRLEGQPAGGISLRERGVYWITGGLGGVGLELAKYLAQTVQARLVLTGRSALPPREDWPAWLDSHPEADPVSDKLRKIKALEALGAEVLVMAADSSHEPQMQAIISAITRQFGTLNGVIHAAGVVAVTPLAEIGPAQCEPQFQSKGPGLVTLAKVLQGQPLDFCLVTSSLSAILGGLGFGAYAAANCYMDAFVQAQNQSGNIP
jgi:NAD(P)-dependent dehydrogenase (short-subunit alcohol dehydrogenase family)